MLSISLLFTKDLYLYNLLYLYLLSLGETFEDTVRPTPISLTCMKVEPAIKRVTKSLSPGATCCQALGLMCTFLVVGTQIQLRISCQVFSNTIE